MLASEKDQLFATLSELRTEKLAVAFSGGGDSTALLHLLRDVPYVTHAFIIDHNLRAKSEVETQASAEFARSLGYEVVTKKWDHRSPKTGIQVKARAYRYAAMGEMCRRAGVTHLLTAHTEDDQAETLLMRQARGTGWRGLAGMRQHAYGPLWPALAEVSLVRPLLQVSRQALREYNRDEGVSWIEDPSNKSLDYTRVRARKQLAEDADLKSLLLKSQNESAQRLKAERREFQEWMSQHADLSSHGFIRLRKRPPVELLLHLLRIASGTGGPIDSARREALFETMADPDFKAATLAGAWVLRDGDGFLITRDKVAVLRRRGVEGQTLESVSIKKGETLIWDGRFRIDCNSDDVEVSPAFGQLQNLRELIETKGLFDLPESVRACQPVYRVNDKFIGFGAGEWGDLRVTALAQKRAADLWSII